MQTTVLMLMSLVLIATTEANETPDVAKTRQMIERSLPYLEKKTTEWVEVRKCVTCHHVPMMLWTHFEARQRGFNVDDKMLSNFESTALSQYLGDPDFIPTGQDKEFMERSLGPGTVYLSLALMANSNPTDESTEALVQFRENMFKRQNDNGSWTTKINQPPLIDGHDSMTMLILAATESDATRVKYREPRERTWRWLKDALIRDETQPLSLRIIVANVFADQDEVQRTADRLVARQDASGGWNQKDEMRPDALATGQALYGLSVAGRSADDAVVRRACAFLSTTQQEDGSWLVKTQNPNSKGFVISFYGTGWATLGLLRTLPKSDDVSP